MIRQVFISGYPGPVGGANTECYHTVKLWRRFGLDVTLIPTGFHDPDYHKRLEAIGARTVEAKAEELKNVPGLPGAVVVSMCNGNFFKLVSVFRKLGCKLVWVNCMTWLFDGERKVYGENGVFDRYVFQSKYQRGLLEHRKWLGQHGYKPEQGHLIRGAFAIDEFPFNPRPHAKGDKFVIGRLSRHAPDKYSSDTWAIYKAIHKRIPHGIRVRIMSWDKTIQKKVGLPPPWAKCLSANAESPQEFIGRLHAMVQINGGAGENWPRSGLEAMATGAPLVVQDQWGWREMVRHGETGWLCADDHNEFGYRVGQLAWDEDLRMHMAETARKVLVEEYAQPEVIWAGWKRLFESLEG